MPRAPRTEISNPRARARVSAALLAFLVALSSGETRADDVLDRIDKAARAGALSEDERILQRVAAVRAPERLPEAGRSGVASASRPCATDILFEAFQQRDRLSPAGRAELNHLLGPPEGLPLSAERAGPFPVQVAFKDESQRAYAERILEAVEISFEREVVEWGFWAPRIEPGSGPYRIYIDSAGAGAAAYTAPYLGDPSTPHEDAFTYIVVDPALSEVFLDVTVAHELNHACQAAMDMMEPASFFENTASYVESLVFPAGRLSTVAMYPFFQSQPYRPLEWAASGRSDGYEYGGGLWLLFLAHEYGAGDPRFVRRLWEGSVQEGPLNEPDHRDVIDQLVAGQGGAASAVAAFGVARFFTGAYDDGAHFPSAREWSGSEVRLTASWNARQLPILDQRPDPSTRPRPSGCNYVAVTADPRSALPLRITFDGDPGRPWNVTVIERPPGSPAVVRALTLDAEAHGVITVSQEDIDMAVLAVCQGLWPDQDFDDKYWPDGDYRYSVELDVPAPVLLAMTPAELTLGAHRSEATLTGRDFHAGPGLEVVVSGTKVAVSEVTAVSAAELRVLLTVGPDAALGPRDVSVINPGGASHTAPALLNVRPAEVPAALGPPEGAAAGCGCSSTRRAREGVAWWSMLGLFFMLARRSRSVRAASAVLALLLAIASAPVAWALPPPSAGYVESARLPIRVHYTARVTPALAEEALGYAERSYDALFGAMGLPAPTTLDDGDAPLSGIWLYLDPRGNGNLAQALGDNPATPRTDCLARIIVASTSPASVLQSIVTTELAQVALLSADCGESMFAWKSSAVALTSLVLPHDALFPEIMLPVFQQHPQAGLDCTFVTDSSRLWYHYGAALFWRFLDDAYGAGDGQLLARLWAAAQQDGTVTSAASGLGELDVPNEPDVLDAAATVSGTTLDEVMRTFARWRYFVGARDDGAHFRQGSEWFGAEVAIDTSLELSQLPILEAAPVAAVTALGSSFIELALAGIDANTGLRVRFRGDPSVRWAADVLLVRSDKTAEVRTIELVDGASGEIVLDGLSGFDHATMIATHLPDGSHDADAPTCNAASTYGYDLEPVDLATPPTVLAVSPASLVAGKSHEAWISGADLADGLTVSLGDGIDVLTADRIDATSVAVSLAVRADATPGPRDVTVQNPNGKSGTLRGAIEVTLAPAIGAPLPAVEGRDGCSCRAARSAPGALWAWAWVLVASLGCLIVRRRAVPPWK
ncbi:MAG: hypothetical protein IT384_19470 [Deltaproteobacteria bacterium]|nr:hypothetical protein [Deltaproteobacteria bacterium]